MNLAITAVLTDDEGKQVASETVTVSVDTTSGSVSLDVKATATER